MSAAAVWSVAPATDVVGAPSRRPELRLVPTGRAAHAAAAPLRITRFGRLLVLASAVTLGVVLLVSALGAGSAAATIDHTVTVSSGQTLSQVAAHELPGLSVEEGVAQIQLVNGLSSPQVHAGQRLAIPALP